MNSSCAYPAVLIMLAVSLIFSVQVSAEDQDLVNMFKEAHQFYGKGYYMNAEVLCKKIVERDPSFYRAYNLLGTLYAMKQNYEWDAIQAFKRSLEIAPDQIGAENVYNSMGVLYSNIDMDEEAVNILNEGLSRYPDDFNLNMNAGRIYLLELHQGYKAYERLTKANEIKPNNPNVIYLLGLSQIDTGDRFAALESVTLLRDLNYEQFAAQLEDLIRQADMMENRTSPQEFQSRGQDKSYSRPKGDAVLVGNESPASNVSGPNDSTAGGRGSDAQVQGAGTIQIRTRFVPKNPEGSGN